MAGVGSLGADPPARSPLEMLRSYTANASLPPSYFLIKKRGINAFKWKVFSYFWRR